MRYVIVGNSISATAAAEAIREYDTKGALTIISDEPYLNYSRPLLSYLLAKKISPEEISYQDKDFYRENRIELLLSKKAKELDLKRKEVILGDKRKVKFDRLLLATGGLPVIPQIKGLDSSGVFTFTGLLDAEAIGKYIKDNQVQKAVVIGGGLIGLKVSQALLELKINITIVELADRILSATFDKRASSIIEAALKRIGCSLIANNTVTEIKPASSDSGEKNPKGKISTKAKNNQAKEIILRDGRRIQADLVMVAIGTRPNIGLVKNSPIKVDRGILVDNFMQTSVRDIYAAGDCCQGKDLLSGENKVIAIWPMAAAQGRTAGYNMAGAKKEYQGGLAMNSVQLCGIPTISVGQTDAEGRDYEALEYADEDKSVYRKAVLKNNILVGAILVGRIERAGIYTGLIKDGLDVSSFKQYLLKEDFGLINLPREYRKHLVTGGVATL